MDTEAMDIEAMMAADDFEGLGKKVQQLFRLPQGLCKTRGNCCRVATFKGTLSVEDIRRLADSDDEEAQNAREFLTLFEAYASQDEVREIAPAFVDRVRDGMAGNPDDVTFFHCRFVGPEGRCDIWEDRPTGCRVYPFPHDKTIYHPGCGFEQTGIRHWHLIKTITDYFDRRSAELEAQMAEIDAKKQDDSSR